MSNLPSWACPHQYSFNTSFIENLLNMLYSEMNLLSPGLYMGDAAHSHFS
jgi:hypothetical protein